MYVVDGFRSRQPKAKTLRDGGGKRMNVANIEFILDQIATISLSYVGNIVQQRRQVSR